MEGSHEGCCAVHAHGGMLELAPDGFQVLGLDGALEAQVLGEFLQLGDFLTWQRDTSVDVIEDPA